MRQVTMVMAVLGLVTLVACGTTTTPATTDEDTSAADATGADGTGVDAAGDATATGRADLTWAPEKTGPFGVGYRRETLTFVTTPEGVTRTIEVSVWYPTNDTTGTPAVYFDPLPLPTPDVFQNAKLAPPVDPAGYPVHLFTHGHLGFAGSSPLMSRHFASHGWVVIAPDHTGNTTVDNSGPKPKEIFWWREMDDVACLDWLANLKAPDPLAGLARVEHTFVSGHSFGSMDTWALSGVPYNMTVIANHCEKQDGGADCDPAAVQRYAKFQGDKRVASVAILAGGVDSNVYAPESPTLETLPTLVMTGTADTGHPAAPLWDPLPHGIWVDVVGGCHQLFGLGDCEPPLTIEVGPPIVWTYTLAFARQTILGDHGPEVTAILDGSRQVSTYATLKKK